MGSAGNQGDVLIWQALALWQIHEARLSELKDLEAWWFIMNSHSLIRLGRYMSMTLRKITVTPMREQCSYCSPVLSHGYQPCHWGMQGENNVLINYISKTVCFPGLLAVSIVYFRMVYVFKDQKSIHGLSWICFEFFNITSTSHQVLLFLTRKVIVM